MTAIASTRGRIVMVAIHASKPQVDMFQFFWRELELIGVRVYEKEDYEKAISIIVNGGVDRYHYHGCKRISISVCL